MVVCLTLTATLFILYRGDSLRLHSGSLIYGDALLSEHFVLTKLIACTWWPRKRKGYSSSVDVLRDYHEGENINLVGKSALFRIVLNLCVGVAQTQYVGCCGGTSCG